MSPLRPREGWTSHGPTTPAISVVIPCRNGGARLVAVAEALAQQRGLAGPVELLLSDTCSSDGAVSVAARRHGQARIWDISPESFNHGLTRQALAEQARAPLVAFLSQDAVPLGRHYLRRLVAAFEAQAVWGASARQVPGPGADPLIRAMLHRWTPPADRLPEATVRWTPTVEAGPPLPCPGAGLCFDDVASMVRRTRLLEHGFPAAEFGEDLLWAARVARAGGTLAYVADAMVEHHHDPTLIESFRRDAATHALLATHFGQRAVAGPFAALLAVPGAFLSDRRDAGTRWAIRGTPRRLAALTGQWWGARGAQS